MDLLSVRYVGKLFLFPVYLEDIKDLMLERSPMNVNNVVNGLVLLLPFKYMKELIMGRSPMNVNHVVSGLVLPVRVRSM
jgi:hypothetical protein